MGKISELMTSDLVTAEPEQSVMAVAQRMNAHGVGAALVVKAEKLVGIFSERDLLSRVIAAGRDPGHTKVGDVATRQLVTVNADAAVKDCVELLREHRIRHLPVVNAAQEPVGIVSARDFFAHVTGELERFIDRSRYQHEIDEGDDPYDHLGGSYDR